MFLRLYYTKVQRKTSMILSGYGLFFINANAAGCYVGIASFLSYSIYKTTSKKNQAFVTRLIYLRIGFFTGSKGKVLFCGRYSLFIYYLASSNKNKITIL